MWPGRKNHVAHTGLVVSRIWERAATGGKFVATGCSPTSTLLIRHCDIIVSCKAIRLERRVTSASPPVSAYNVSGEPRSPPCPGRGRRPRFPHHGREQALLQQPRPDAIRRVHPHRVRPGRAERDTRLHRPQKRRGGVLAARPDRPGASQARAPGTDGPRSLGAVGRQAACCTENRAGLAAGPGHPEVVEGPHDRGREPAVPGDRLG
jgi:hypothetical protein